MLEYLTKPWITFRKTRWSWNVECEQSNFDALISLKKGYSDMVYNMSVQSTKRAMNDGCDITINYYKQFSIIHRYSPDSVPDEVWVEMCDLWASEAWGKKSSIVKSNSNKGKEKGARHTGRSIGYDEYRVQMGTHIYGNISSYPSRQSVEIKIVGRRANLNSLMIYFFCNDRYKEAYASYVEEMIEKNGSDFSVDDPDVWARVVEPNLKWRRRVYGIGSSDINYMVNGIASSSSGVTQSDTKRLSQQKIHELEVQMEAEKKARQELEEEIRRERQEQHEMQ